MITAARDQERIILDVTSQSESAIGDQVCQALGERLAASGAKRGAQRDLTRVPAPHYYRPRLSL